MAINRQTLALLIAVPVLCLLVAANTYVFTNNLKRVGQSTSQRTSATAAQTEIGDLLRNLDEMEASERGYLLTADPSYLRPYGEAKARFDSDFSKLHSRWSVTASVQERSHEAQLESVTRSRIADLEQGIRLREQGYRLRAFQLVDSNRGKDLMEQAREILNGLWIRQSRAISQLDTELNDNLRRTYRQAAEAAIILLLAVAATLLAFHLHANRLASRCVRQSEELRTTSVRVERFSSALSQDFRALVGHTRSDSSALLHSSGGFLPRQGQEQAERIHEAASKMNDLLDDLLDQQRTDECVASLHDAGAEKLTA